MRLLLAEDEKELSRALEVILKHNHYSVDAVYDGADALDYALTDNYDGIILDIMMPKMSGSEVLAELRTRGIATPVLMLTAKSDTQDLVAGLDGGADDYMTKPFVMAELLARIRAMVRRKTDFTPNIFQFSDINLNKATFELYNLNSCFRLSNKEFQMLEMLMSNSGHLISVSQFMERIWGYDAETENNVVWVYISHLRKKLLSMKAKVEIKVVRGVGYTLEETK